MSHIKLHISKRATVKTIHQKVMELLLGECGKDVTEFFFVEQNKLLSKNNNRKCIIWTTLFICLMRLKHVQYDGHHCLLSSGIFNIACSISWLKFMHQNVMHMTCYTVFKDQRDHNRWNTWDLEKKMPPKNSHHLLMTILKFYDLLMNSFWCSLLGNAYSLISDSLYFEIS